MRGMGLPHGRGLTTPAVGLLLVMVLLCKTATAAPPPDKVQFDFGGPGGALAALGRARLERIRRVNGQADKTLEEVAQMLEGESDLVRPLVVETLWCCLGHMVLLPAPGVPVRVF